MSTPGNPTDAATAVDPEARYYDAGGIETLDILRAKLTPEQYTGFLLGTLLTYACRLNFKGVTASERARDAQKMTFYATWLHEHLDAGVRDVDAAIAKHRALIDERFPVEGEEKRPVCVQCGCTELRACVGEQGPCGWAWVNYESGMGLCTACEERVASLADAAASPASCGCPPHLCNWLMCGGSRPEGCELVPCPACDKGPCKGEEVDACIRAPRAEPAP